MFKLVLCVTIAATASALNYKPFTPYRPLPVAPVAHPVAHTLPLATRTYSHGPEIAILRNDQDIREDGSYSYAYETANGIAAQEQGTQNNLAKAAQGSYSYTSPEGEVVQISYVADVNGFQPTGSHIPPIPLAIQRSLEYNAAHPQASVHTYTPLVVAAKRRFF